VTHENDTIESDLAAVTWLADLLSDEDYQAESCWVLNDDESTKNSALCAKFAMPDTWTQIEPAHESLGAEAWCWLIYKSEVPVAVLNIRLNEVIMLSDDAPIGRHPHVHQRS
jgi:hypothetical protein